MTGRSLYSILLLLCCHVLAVTASLSYWRLRIVTQNPSVWEVYFYELAFYDASSTKISGTYTSSLGVDTYISYLSDGNTATAFRFPYTGTANIVGQYIQFVCTGGCTPYRVYILQYSQSSNRVYSMILESSVDGTTWSAESPVFNTNVLTTNYYVSYPTTQPTFRPSVEPSQAPTRPTASPTAEPTDSPTYTPSNAPSAVPTMQPTTPLALMLARFRTSPTFAVRNGFAFAALTANRTVLTWGEGENGGDSSFVQALLTQGDVARVVSGRYSFAALRDGGSVVVWGDPSVVRDHNNQQILGLSGVVASESAFAGVHLATASAVALGNPHTGGTLSSALTNVLSLTASAGAFAALKVDGTVVAWGNQHYGGATPAEVQAALLGVVQVVATRDSFAARLLTGRVLTWGSSIGGGELSAAATSQLSSGVMHIVASDSVFAALKNDSSLVTWGHGPWGGDSSSVAAQLSANVTFVAHTSTAMAALKLDGTVVTWGQADGGGDSSAVQSVLRDVKTIVGNSKAFAALMHSGKVVVWGRASHGGSLPSDSDKVAVLQGGSVVSLHATHRAFAALTSTGRLVVWGQAGHGGGPSAAVEALLLSSVHSVCANDVAFSALKTDGSVVAWGHAISVATPGVQFVNEAAQYKVVC